MKVALWATVLSLSMHSTCYRVAAVGLISSWSAGRTRSLRDISEMPPSRKVQHQLTSWHENMFFPIVARAIGIDRSAWAKTCIDTRREYSLNGYGPMLCAPSNATMATTWIQRPLTSEEGPISSGRFWKRRSKQNVVFRSDSCGYPAAVTKRWCCHRLWFIVTVGFPPPKFYQHLHLFFQKCSLRGGGCSQQVWAHGAKEWINKTSGVDR